MKFLNPDLSWGAELLRSFQKDIVYLGFGIEGELKINRFYWDKKQQEYIHSMQMGMNPPRKLPPPS